MKQIPASVTKTVINETLSDETLPAVFKTIDGIMKIYAGTDKQVFIAFDKQDSYPKGTRRILADNMVLKLSDNNSELYGESWNKEESK